LACTGPDIYKQPNLHNDVK